MSYPRRRSLKVHGLFVCLAIALISGAASAQVDAPALGRMAPTPALLRLPAGVRFIEPGDVPDARRIVSLDPSRFDMTQDDGAFFVLQDGFNLRSVDRYKRLRRVSGLGYEFRAREWRLYRNFKGHPKVHWAARRMRDGALVAKGKTFDKGVWGASVTKALVVAALLDRESGELDATQWHSVIELLVNSDNRYWAPIEEQAGLEDDIDAFFKRIGYPRLRATRRLNWLNARDVSGFMHDLYRGRLAGSEALFKVMAACRTGATKSRKYLPRHVHVVGKTGTSNEYRHDSRFVNVEGEWYAVSVLTEMGDNEPVALLYGGLYREVLLPDARRHRTSSRGRAVPERTAALRR